MIPVYRERSLKRFEQILVSSVRGKRSLNIIRFDPTITSANTGAIDINRNTSTRSNCFRSPIIPNGDVLRALIAVVEAEIADIAVLDAAIAAIAVWDEATAAIAVEDVTTALSATLLLITAAIAVEDAATAAIAV